MCKREEGCAYGSNLVFGLNGSQRTIQNYNRQVQLKYLTEWTEF